MGNRATFSASVLALCFSTLHSMISVSRCARLYRSALPFPNHLLISWRIKLRHMLQEVLIVGENHVVKRMFMT